jgi:hypothetical protein
VRAKRVAQVLSFVEEPSRIDQTPSMNFHRITIALLLTIALPYSVAASVFDAGACRHAGKATPADVSMHHDHAAMVMGHSHDVPATPAGHDNCDCPLQCDCASPCSGGAWTSVAVRQLFEFANVDNVSIGEPVARVSPDVQHIPVFRPPIAVLTGAA